MGFYFVDWVVLRLRTLLNFGWSLVGKFVVESLDIVFDHFEVFMVSKV